jgi:hypothetical protein
VLAGTCGQAVVLPHVLNQLGLLLFMLCHIKAAMDPAPEAVIYITTWNNIRDAFEMPRCKHSQHMPKVQQVGVIHPKPQLGLALLLSSLSVEAQLVE